MIWLSSYSSPSFLRETPNSISRWNGFFANKDNPSFSVYTLGYLLAFFPVISGFKILFKIARIHLCISWFYYSYGRAGIQQIQHQERTVMILSEYNRTHTKFYLHFLVTCYCSCRNIVSQHKMSISTGKKQTIYFLLSHLLPPLLT